jgi:hypothetical protein
MIKGFFIINNQGKIRFFRFYDGTSCKNYSAILLNLKDDKRNRIIKRLYKTVSE